MRSRILLLAAALTGVCLTTFPQANAAPIFPIAYDMSNGERGAFGYFDSTYSGTGDVNTGLAELSGGTGELTDGVIPTTGWNVDSVPYVGWLSAAPTIRFHWERTAEIHGVTFSFFNSNGQGGVIAPQEITLTSGGQTVTYSLPSSSPVGPLTIAMSELELVGDYLDAQIVKGTGWVMLSEVTFEGVYVPEPRTAMLLGWVSVYTLATARRSRLAGMFRKR